MKPAALFYDIDGTLYSEIENVVPESAFEALKKAKENGHYLFINTGRTYCSMPSPIKRFPDISVVAELMQNIRMRCCIPLHFR